MKKLLLFSLISWALMACTKDDDTSTLAVTPADPIVFSAAATEVFTLNVTTNECNWEAVSDQSWCRIIPSGSRLIVTAIPNIQDISPVPATITVKAGNAAPVTIRVTQFGSGGGGGDDARLVVTPANPIQFSAEATESFVLNVETNQGPWDAISDQLWCRVSQGGTKVYITALPNIYNFAPAPATITFTSGKAQPITIRVTQLGSGFVYIPDFNFRQAILYLYDKNGDNKLSFEEAALITTLDVSSKNILSLSGIESFTNLTQLNCNQNSIYSLDISKNTKLKSVSANNSHISVINLNGAVALFDLDVSYSNLTQLDVSNNPELFNLNCSHSKLTSVDVSKNTKLAGLVAGYNLLTSVNLNGANQMQLLSLDTNPLTNIDVSSNINLTSISCITNSLTGIDLSNQTLLKTLYLSSNLITSIDLSHNLLVTYVDLTRCKLTGELDVSKNTTLSTLRIAQNPDLITLWLGTTQNIPTLTKDVTTTIQRR